MNKECCKYLGIATKYSKYIYNVRQEAYYWGNFVLLIEADMKQFYDLKRVDVSEANSGSTAAVQNRILFTNKIKCAIVHTGNWSWDYGDIKLSDKTRLAVPFDPEKLSLDSAYSYWLQNIFGWRIEGDWVSIVPAKIKDTNGARSARYLDLWSPTTSASAAKQKQKYKVLATGEWSWLALQYKQEQEYKDTYRKGGCTLWDTNMSRHRNIVYENNPPCGRRCKDCWHFWID